MNSSPCDWLDDFLARDLTPEQERSFRTHSLVCQACDAAVKQQERMDALLTEAVTKLVPVPAALASRVRSRLRRARRRRYLAYSFGTAAAAVIAWLMIQTIHWSRTPPDADPVPHVELVKEKVKEPPAHVSISFADNSKVIVMPEVTDSPDVTFVWVYPNRHPQRAGVASNSRTSH